MKTYKTWEMIKMLTENPKLRFRRNIPDFDAVGEISIGMNDTGSIVNVSNKKVLRATHVLMKADWTLEDSANE